MPSSDFTVQDCKEMIALCLEAKKAILGGAQSYKIGTRMITRATLGEIDKELAFWRKELSNLEGNPRVLRGVPVDL